MSSSKKRKKGKQSAKGKDKKQKMPEPTWTQNITHTSLPATSGSADRLEILKTDPDGLNPVEIFENHAKLNSK